MMSTFVTNHTISPLFLSRISHSTLHISFEKKMHINHDFCEFLSCQIESYQIFLLFFLFTGALSSYDLLETYCFAHIAVRTHCTNTWFEFNSPNWLTFCPHDNICVLDVRFHDSSWHVRIYCKIVICMKNGLYV